MSRHAGVTDGRTNAADPRRLTYVSRRVDEVNAVCIPAKRDARGFDGDSALSFLGIRVHAFAHLNQRALVFPQRVLTRTPPQRPPQHTIQINDEPSNSYPIERCTQRTQTHLIHKVGGGVAVINVSQCADLFGEEEHPLRRSRLARIDVRDNTLTDAYDTADHIQSDRDATQRGWETGATKHAKHMHTKFRIAAVDVIPGFLLEVSPAKSRRGAAAARIGGRRARGGSADATASVEGLKRDACCSAATADDRRRCCCCCCCAGRGCCGRCPTINAAGANGTGLAAYPPHAARSKGPGAEAAATALARWRANSMTPCLDQKESPTAHVRFAQRCKTGSSFRSFLLISCLRFIELIFLKKGMNE